MGEYDDFRHHLENCDGCDYLARRWCREGARIHDRLFPVANPEQLALFAAQWEPR